jgi:ribosomal protein S18 acetylase RimI-like enzyme
LARRFDPTSDVMQVRPATVEDARTVAEIHVRTWQAAYPGIVPTEYLASLSIEKHEAMWLGCIVAGQPQLLVATESDRLLGWVAFGASRDEGAGADVAEIWAIYVGAQGWGQGVGRLLWAHARSRLREQGFTTVGLWAFPENLRAGHFYRALGFEIEPSSGKTFELGGARLNEVRYVRGTDA